MKKIVLIGILNISFNYAFATSISGQGTWEATLLARDLDSNPNTIEAYYDTLLDITWSLESYNQRSLTWDIANNWVTSLDIGGFTGWRLPIVRPLDGVMLDFDKSFIGNEDVGWNISAPGTTYEGSTASEMAHMFYVTLGNNGHCDQLLSTDTICVQRENFGVQNAGPFYFLSDVSIGDPNEYWSSTEVGSPSILAWIFSFSAGAQSTDGKGTYNKVWAVHDGDIGVSSIPIPSTIWLFGSALLGLGFMHKNTLER